MQWSLEDVYKKQVRGKIPPRQHLRVLGESIAWGPANIESDLNKLVGQQVVKTEDGKKFVRDPSLPESEWTEVDAAEASELFNKLYQDCKKAPDPKICFQRLMSRTATSSLVDDFENFLTSDRKAWKNAAAYSKELANKMTDHAARDSDKVQKLKDFLKNPDSHPEFPANPDGNLITDFNKVKGFEIDKEVVKSLMTHSSVDERKRGVGMAELGMSLLFKNIGSATGAGDLAVLGIGDPGRREGFEIKGHGAILGDQPEAHAVEWDLLKYFDIVQSKERPDQFKVEGVGEDGGDKVYGVGQFAYALADIYNSLCDKGSKENFKNRFKEILFDTEGKHKFEGEGMDAVKEVYDEIVWTNGDAINSGIGLMNFVRYASKEQFTHFLVHDFGEQGLPDREGHVKASKPKNEGGYVYVTGTPKQMADELRGRAYFEPIKPNNLRPRILAAEPTGKRYSKGEYERGRCNKLGRFIGKESRKKSGQDIRRISVLPGSGASDEEIEKHIDELST